MYCEDSEWTAVDHFVPRAMDPEQAFTWANYLAACSICNSNYKREEFPRRTDGTRLLLNPVEDDPWNYLVFSPATGRYEAVGQSDMATESIRVFGLNRASLGIGRKDAWDVLQLAIVAYGNAADRNDDEQADRYRAVVTRQPFAGVLKAIIRTAGSAVPLGLSDECLAALAAHPEIQDWPEALFAPDA